MLSFQNKNLRILQGLGIVALLLAFIAFMAVPPLLSGTPGVDSDSPEVNVPAMQNVPSPNAPPVQLETQ